MMMGQIHRFLNIVAPPFTFVFLCFFYPPFLLFKFLKSILSNLVFHESLVGKVVIITGASSGMGEGLAYEYAKRGACLALVARRENALREVAERAINSGCPDCIVIRADVSIVEDCKRIVDETITHFGRLDHLVTSAAIAMFTMLEDVKNITDFRAVMDTNFWGAVYTTHYAIPHLRNRKGKILMVSSPNSWMPVPRNTMYNASKAALSSLYETLRIELKPDVKITIATPGFVDSEVIKGKFLFKDGTVRVDPDARDVQVGAVPVASTEGCAKKIVSSVQRGDNYVTVPYWFGLTYLWKVLCPDVIEWCMICLYMTKRYAPPTEALTKKILDLTGAQNFLYPTSIRDPQIKTD